MDDKMIPVLMDWNDAKNLFAYYERQRPNVKGYFDIGREGMFLGKLDMVRPLFHLRGSP